MSQPNQIEVSMSQVDSMINAIFAPEKPTLLQALAKWQNENNVSVDAIDALEDVLFSYNVKLN